LSEAEVWKEADYMKGEGWIQILSDNGPPRVRLTHEGVKKAMDTPVFGSGRKQSSNTAAPQAITHMTTPIYARNVFVVHGRNLEVRSSLFRFLRSIGLSPLEWSQAIRETGKASPFIGEILDAAFSKAQAVVVLMTPDDVAQLRESLRSPHDPPHESQLTGQARPNVLFEAGMAMGRNPDRTIIVELGTLRPFSDIGGRHVLKLSNATQDRQELAQRLETAGCPVNLTGRDWHTEGDFNLKLEDKITKLEPQNDEKARRRYLRERLGEFLSEGDTIRWGMLSQQSEAHKKFDPWLKQVEQFLAQEPEFDNSHIARFKAEQLIAIKEFIKEI
jgi:predicted nucleotide-binding protein